MKQKLFLLVALMACATFSEARIWMPRMFQPGMVLQRGKPIPVWGTADRGEQVVLTFNKKKYTAMAGIDGRWRIDLPAMKAGGPYTLTVGDVTLDNILIGDVWLCSGQSNIDVTVERVYPQYPGEIDADSNDRIRLFRVQTTTDTRGPRDDVRAGEWKTLSKQNAWQFSAVGYFLAKRMFAETKVPQGIICNSLGGTPVEAWVDADSLRQDFPLYYRQTLLYRNDEIVQSQSRADRLMAEGWLQLLNDSDPGVSGGWTTFECDDSQWRRVDQYEPLVPGRQFVGSLWLRQHLHIDAAHAGRPCRLLVGTLYDQDFTYVNGREVGRTYYQYPPRRYAIPAGLLREGDNVLTVRFVNKQGVPHFIKEKPYMLIFDDTHDTLRLSPQWLLHEGTRMPACPQSSQSVQNLPSVLYNAMLHPLAPFALSGVVWYQGESNTGRPDEYGPLLRKLMGGWRQLWNDPALPFVIVQLANYMEPSQQPQESGWAQLREQQRQVAKDDAHAELAVAIDLGETVDIHPLRKKEVAERIALGFDRLVYGNKKVQLSPEVVAAAVDKGRVVLTFDQPLRPGELFEFELAGSNGRFANATATASGRTVTIETQAVPAPQRVRYAWKNNPIRANAYSQGGLPVAPFEWKL